MKKKKKKKKKGKNACETYLAVRSLILCKKHTWARKNQDNRFKWKQKHNTKLREWTTERVEVLNPFKTWAVEETFAATSSTKQCWEWTQVGPCWEWTQYSHTSPTQGGKVFWLNQTVTITPQTPELFQRKRTCSSHVPHGKKKKEEKKKRKREEKVRTVVRKLRSSIRGRNKLRHNTWLQKCAENGEGH